MYPESFLWWLGGIAVLFGILGLVFLLAMAVDNWTKKRYPPKDKEDDLE